MGANAEMGRASRTLTKLTMTLLAVSTGSVALARAVATAPGQRPFRPTSQASLRRAG